MKDSQQPYDELKNGRVEAVLQENIITVYYASKYPELHIVPKTFSPGKYAIAFRKTDTKLREEVDRALEEMKKNGELAAIYRKWNIMNELQAQVGVEEKK